MTEEKYEIATSHESMDSNQGEDDGFQVVGKKKSEKSTSDRTNASSKGKNGQKSTYPKSQAVDKSRYQEYSPKGATASSRRPTDKLKSPTTNPVRKAENQSISRPISTASTPSKSEISKSTPDNFWSQSQGSKISNSIQNEATDKEEDNTAHPDKMAAENDCNEEYIKIDDVSSTVIEVRIEKITEKLDMIICKSTSIEEFHELLECTEIESSNGSLMGKYSSVK